MMPVRTNEFQDTVASRVNKYRVEWRVTRSSCALVGSKVTFSKD